MAYIRRNQQGKIQEYCLVRPVDEKTKTPEAGWELISDTAAELQDFFVNPPARPTPPNWKEFRNEVELSEQWLTMSGKTPRTATIAAQISSILWNDSSDLIGLTLRWQKLFQEANPTPAQVDFIRQKAIQYGLPQTLIDLIK